MDVGEKVQVRRGTDLWRGLGVGWALALLAVACCEAQEPIMVRLSPVIAATNVFALRIGVQLALDGPPESMRFGAACDAFRKIGVGFLRWPSGGGRYNWYDGVGPLGSRHSPEGGDCTNVFGTVEFARFCSRVGAEPLVRVSAALPGLARDEEVEMGPQLAADWVAYCNATNDHPLAVLRRRHGLPDALAVRFWEVDASDEGTNAPSVVARICGAYAEGMCREDPSVAVGIRVARAETARAVLGLPRVRVDFLSCGVDGAKGFARAAWADTAMASAPDSYIATVLKRLADAAPAERAYFGGWYDALGLAQAAMGRLRHGGAGVCVGALSCGDLVREAATGAWEPTEKGLVVGLVNRFPALSPLALPDAPEARAAGIGVAAAWTEDPRTLVVFVDNAGPGRRRVKIDLGALNRRFVFWAYEQLEAEIARPREAAGLPIICKQKVGSALRQVVEIDCLPASFTRIAVKE